MFYVLAAVFTALIVAIYGAIGYALNLAVDALDWPAGIGTAVWIVVGALCIWNALVAIGLAIGLTEE